MPAARPLACSCLFAVPELAARQSLTTGATETTAATGMPDNWARRFNGVPSRSAEFPDPPHRGPAAQGHLLLNHGPVTLVSSASGERRNVMVAPVGDAPRFRSTQSRCRHRQVDADPRTDRGGSGEFVLNIPTRTIAEQVLAAGSASGHEGDKSPVGIATEKAEIQVDCRMRRLAGWNGRSPSRATSKPTISPRRGSRCPGLSPSSRDGRWHLPTTQRGRSITARWSLCDRSEGFSVDGKCRREV